MICSQSDSSCSLYTCPICLHCIAHCLGHYQLLPGLSVLLRPIHARTHQPMALVANLRFVAVRDLQKKAA